MGLKVNQRLKRNQIESIINNNNRKIVYYHKKQVVLGKNSESTSIVSSTRTNIIDRENRSKDAANRTKTHSKQKSMISNRRDNNSGAITTNQNGYMNFHKKDAVLTTLGKSSDRKYSHVVGSKHRMTTSNLAIDNHKRSSPVPSRSKDQSKKESRIWVYISKQ